MKIRAVTVTVAESLLKMSDKICRCLCVQAGATGEIWTRIGCSIAIFAMACKCLLLAYC